MKKFITLFLIFLTHQVFAQNTSITGLILEEGTEEAIIGASVVIKGTTTGTSTDIEGRFTLQTNQSGELTLQISSVGMTSIEKVVKINAAEQSKLNLGQIYLKSDVIGLAEVEVLASVAIDRKTPVAVSTIKPELIEEKLGTQEFPEILKSTPGIYATKSGGGFGDARVNIRGFNSENVAVMINGVPVNDMENGKVYWSNWAGLSDVTRTMQVQRGLGAAKVAVPSIGGTINILTKTTDAEKGGKVFYGIGNNGYQKKAFTVSTGLNDNGWAMTLSGSHTAGDGYVDATAFEGWSYFINIAKRINMNHQLSFTAFGAPQTHGQRSTQHEISKFEDENYGHTYNSDWGYKDGEVYNVRTNFYHKPQISLNHYWTVSEKTDISTSAYVSFATGGGTGTLGENKFQQDEYIVEGQIDFDRIVAENAANGSQGSTSIIRASNNNHNWYGLLSSINTEVNSNLTFTGGLDLRYYLGEHYRDVVDLLGGEHYADSKNINNPNHKAKVGDVVDYNNDGEVSWIGLFGQAEYELNDLTAFVAASVSQTGYRRTDYFKYEDSDPLQQSDWAHYMGFMTKGGANYNIDDNHNVFMNVGYFEKAPIFDVAFSGRQNIAFEDAENEKIFSAELGYGYKSRYLNVNVNIYRTHWMDKAQAYRYEDEDNNIDEYVNITGVDAIHQGIELEASSSPIHKLNITGMVSIGDWRWANDIENREIFLADGTSAGFVNIFRNDTHVGNAAQTTAALGISYELIKDFKVGVDYTFFGDNYADFDVAANVYEEPLTGDKLEQEKEKGSVEAWQMPDVSLFDLSFSYKFKIANLDAKLLGKVNNLFDTEYITDARDGGSSSWQGSRVYYGFGRTWSTSLSINF